MASTEMDSKVGLESSAAATPAVSVRHSTSRRDSIELATLNNDQSQTTVVQSAIDDAAESRREMIALAAVSWTQFMAGWNDGTLGPLIPRIQNYYGVSHIFRIGFIIVSMLFVSACIGFITGAILVIHLTDRYGFGRVLIAGSAFQIVVYSVLSVSPPFPVMCVALVLNGIGMAFQNAQTSAMVISLTKNPGLKMGILQAGYGAGACVAPLIATQFAAKPRWSFYYLVSLGLAITNTLSLSYVFRFRRLPEVLASFGIPEVVHTAEHSQTNKYRQILSLRVVYILAFFCLIYVGAEVTIGGWIVTFLIDTRGGGASAGYVSSGFFAGNDSIAVSSPLLNYHSIQGLMLGRLALIWVNHKVGERRVVYIYSALIIALEFVIWFTPSLILNAVAVSVVGLLLGYVVYAQAFERDVPDRNNRPFYPILMNQSGNMLPAWYVVDRGRQLDRQVGVKPNHSATFAERIYLLQLGASRVGAQKHGVQVMQPLIVSLVILMSLTWAVIPRVNPRELTGLGRSRLLELPNEFPFWVVNPKEKKLIRAVNYEHYSALTVPMRTAVLVSALTGGVVALKWSQTKTVLAFGDSYTFVQGTLGHTGFSFWGDRFNLTITKAQVQTNEIVANITSSDGANWIEMITSCYSGLPSECPRTLWNFAFAGADIDPAILTLHHNYTVDLTEQAPGDCSMAAFFIGINDTGDTSKWTNSLGLSCSWYQITDWTTFWNTELDSYFNAVNKVYQTGLRSFLFLNVPPTDRAPGSTPGRTSQIPNFNSLLAGRVDLFKKDKKDVSVILFDTNTYLNGILNNATQYGFTNTTGFCQCSDPGYFWYNSGHITQRTHRLLADGILKELQKTG
ncbi:hypothetical protein FRC10_000575 [Ceratobasidium sp. 414]|nr:hypothetical protein FRC10_000575 [Ceratobasidium sp. 414]